MNEFIRVEGARVNNLKNVSVTLPRDKLVVLTGLSGSGKSSLAFDTIYAEGQRRYIESMSSYARMFLGQSEKPDVIFHLAAQADVGKSWKQPQATMQMNVTAAINVMEAVRAVKGKQVAILMVGSSDQYGNLGEAGCGRR